MSEDLRSYRDKAEDFQEILDGIVPIVLKAEKEDDAEKLKEYIMEIGKLLQIEYGFEFTGMMRSFPPKYRIDREENEE